MEITESSDEFAIKDIRNDWRVWLAFLEITIFLATMTYNILEGNGISLVKIIVFVLLLLIMMPLFDGFYSFLLPKATTITGRIDSTSISIKKEYFFGFTKKQIVDFQNAKSLNLNILWEIRPGFFLKRFFFRLKIINKDNSNINIDFSPTSEFDQNSDKIVSASNRIAQTYDIPLLYNPKPISAWRRIVESQK